MKSEKGITLVALVTIIIVLIILTSLGVYTNINSYKIMKIQKYKAKMQEIQNEVDELYEEYKEYFAKTKTIDEFLNEKNIIKEKNNVDDAYSFKINDQNEDYFSDELNDFINNNGFKIENEKIESGYYLFSKQQIENVFGIKEIDFSDEFLINFEKRYVFSITPLEILDKEGKKINIYSLYQLAEEEKVVGYKEITGEFIFLLNKLNNNSYLITIISKKANIKNIQIKIGDEYVDIESRKDYYSRLTGLNTKEVQLELTQRCEIKAIDTLNQEGICNNLLKTLIFYDDGTLKLDEKKVLSRL